MSGGGFEQLSAAISAALDADLTGLDAAALVEAERVLESVRSRLAAVDVRVVAELEARSVAGDFGRSSTVDLLVSELRVTPGEARARVGRAGDLGPRSTLIGEPLSALMPVVSDALAAGAISTEHVAVITKAMEDLPSTVPLPVFGIVESALVDAARFEHPGQLRKIAALLLARLDPDGDEPRDAEVERKRGVTLTRHADGSGRLAGRLTVEATAVWDAIMDSLAAPVPSEDGERDDRTAAQRRHDGLVEAGRRVLRSGSLPAAGGVPVTVLVRTTLAELRAGDGVAFTSRGDLWSVAAMTKTLSDAEIVPVLIDVTGRVLNLGRSRRLASKNQRVALAVRDGGCSFPGCDRPPGWTEAHHVTPWQHGGMTDVENLCLLCRFHHREFGPRGWTVTMTDGSPEWTPPAWLDPHQRPRRNKAHHLIEPDVYPARSAAVAA